MDPSSVLSPGIIPGVRESVSEKKEEKRIKVSGKAVDKGPP
jgi:hypothetical protein